MYADYSFYKNEYLGTLIEEKDFARLVTRAGEEIDYVIGNRAAKISGSILVQVKKASCSLAELIHEEEKSNALTGIASGDMIVSSESVDGVSTSFVISDTSTISGQASIALKKQAIINKYLLNTGLLYAGVNYAN